jgi:tetratricopeptide (TPR) repeat protein
VPATTSSPADSRIAQAIAMRLKGKSAAAERMLRLVVKDKPGNLSAWSLLAEILLNSGELGEVERTVLPAMRLACAQGDATLADMTEGCLRMHPKALRLKEARACFLRALSKAPSLSAASELLLRTDQLAGDAAQLEEDALLIVKESPGHATANALLGSLRLSQRRYADAEKHLRLSLACDPAAGALNDLAELLRQQGKLAEAEQQARLAIRLAPDLHQAWDTLGGILLDAGRTEEAMGPLRCAIAFGPTGDVRPHLTLTRVRIKEGRLQEAGAILDRVSPLPSQTAPTTLQEYAALRKQVADGRAMP